MVRVHLLISGQVQGVLYRSFCQKFAISIGLTGWVKNTFDNKVEIVAEGTKEQLEKLISWTQTGSPYSQVENVKVGWEEASGEFKGFEVR